MKEATLEQYNRATSNPNLHKRIMAGKRDTAVLWSLCGTPVAEKLEIYRYGKVIETFYRVNEKFL